MPQHKYLALVVIEASRPLFKKDLSRYLTAAVAEYGAIAKPDADPRTDASIGEAIRVVRVRGVDLE